MTDILHELIRTPVFSLLITFGVFRGAQVMMKRTNSLVFHPVMVSIAVLVGWMLAADIEYDTYMNGGRIISFFLGPAVVALGVPLYLQLPEIQKRAAAIAAAVTVGSVVGVASAFAMVIFMGGPVEVAISIAPKSATTPIAIGIAESVGGIPPLTAGLVIVTGIIGAILGPGFLRLIGVKSPVAVGLALGGASHGIGTARAMEEGPLTGASAGLAIGLNGLATALVTPAVVKIALLLLG